MKCLLKYQWVKLPRSQMPAGKGVMGAWVRLAPVQPSATDKLITINMSNPSYHPPQAHGFPSAFWLDRLIGQYH